MSLPFQPPSRRAREDGLGDMDRLQRPGGLRHALLCRQASHSTKPSHVLLVNFLAAWVAAFTTTSINIALPSIQTEFHLGVMALGWLTLSYGVVSAVFLLPFGKIGDRYGRHLLFLIGLTIFSLSSVALIYADTYHGLLVFRAAQGVGAAMMWSTSIAMVTLAYPPHKRGWAMGVSVAASYLGQTTGPALGGVIVYNLGWRNLFLVTACFSFLTLGLDVLLLRGAEWREERLTGFDWAGSTVYAFALSALLLGLSWLPLKPGVILLFGGIAGLALFVWWETRARSPVVDFRIFRGNRVFAFSSLTALISYSSVWAVTFLMSLYLQFIKGLNAQTSGLVLIAAVALQCVFSPLGGRLSDRIQPRWIVSAGMVLCGIGLFLLCFLRADTSYWYIVLALCLLGLGSALFSGPNQNSIMGSVKRRHAGFASASIATVRIVGISLSIAVATLIMALIVGRHDIQPDDYPNLLAAVRTAFAFFTAGSIVAVLISLARGKMPAQEVPADTLLNERRGPKNVGNHPS